jgi:hypothetical protein
MKLQEKDKLLRGILSAPNALDAKLNLLQRHVSEEFPNLPPHRETGRRYKQIHPYYIKAPKFIIFKVRGFAKKE